MKYWISRKMGFTGLHIAKFDRSFLRSLRKTVCQPTSIRGPGDTVNPAIVTAVDYDRGGFFQVNHDQFVTMIRNGNHIVGGRDCQTGCPSKFDVLECLWFASIFWIEDNQCFASNSIADGDQSLAIIEPFQQAITYPIQFTMLEDSSFPVGHREGFASCCNGYRVALWM